MAFLNDTDYKDHVQDDILDKVINSDVSIRTKAELKVQSLIESYLRVKYDVANIFSRTGASRSQVIVMYMIDMVVYRVFSRLAPSQIPQHVNDKYADAIKWLEMVSASKLSPDLPVPPEEGETNTAPMRHGSNVKRESHY